MEVGLQLFSVRNDMEKDMKATLKKVKEMGYTCVEFAGYYGHSAEEVKAMLDETGLTCISVHQTYTVFLEDEKKNIDFLKTIGAKYCVVPWMDRAFHKGGAEYEKAVKDFINIGRALKENGIQLAYHNHEFEFEKYEGKFLLDWLYEAVPADILETEIDTCWARYAGYDPAEYLLKYSGRSHIIHFKDFVCKNFADGPVYSLIGDDGREGKIPSRNESGFEFRALGDGIVDFKALIEACKKAGTEYVIVEQDQESQGLSALEAAAKSRAYLKSLGI